VDSDHLEADEAVLVEEVDGVAWVGLHRPAQLNALTYPMMDRLGSVLEGLAARPDIRAVAITGRGDAFCAGADTKEMAERTEMDPAARRGRITEFGRSALLLHLMEKPTVSVINGVAVGAGLGLALACDIRLMGATARLRPGFARIGTSGDFGVTWFATRLLGPARALKLLFDDEMLTAPEALSYGLVDEVVPDDQLEERAEDVLRRLAAGPTRAFAGMKANVTAATALPLAAAMEVEADEMIGCLTSQDHAEAIAALRDKRPATYQGR
jgi:2-(1,2-epoxy-1,2-dihydrophenyl)acetyl-CoA isomerase